MKNKRNLNNLKEFRKLIQRTQHLETQSIDGLIKVAPVKIVVDFKKLRLFKLFIN